MSAAAQRTLLLATFDDAFAERVAAALYPAFQVVRAEPRAEELAKMAQSSGADLCLLDIEETSWNGTPNLEIVAALRPAAPQLPILIATYDVSVDVILPAMRAGANDVCDKDFAVDELTGQLDRHVRARAPRRGEVPGRMHAVLGPRGGVGATTIAVAVALELAERGGAAEKVLLVDLSHPPPVAPDILGLRATYFMTDAINDLARLDATLIESAFARVKASPLFVLPLAANEAGLYHFNAPDAFGLIAVLRTYFRHVVVDASATRRVGLSDRLFLDADGALLCCDQSIPTLHAASAFLNDLQERYGAEADFVPVVTRYTSLLRPTPEEICTALGARHAPALMPDDRVRIDMARNAGEPLHTRRLRTPFAKSVRRLVDRITEGEAHAPPAAARSPSRRSRWGLRWPRLARGGEGVR